LASQPYNVALWTRAYLALLGIEPSTPPTVLPVILRGRFVEAAAIGEEMAQRLAGDGFAGAYSPSGFSTDQQLVVWLLIGARIRRRSASQAYDPI
jgi:hypothetical protein